MEYIPAMRKIFYLMTKYDAAHKCEKKKRSSWILFLDNMEILVTDNMR